MTPAFQLLIKSSWMFLNKRGSMWLFGNSTSRPRNVSFRLAICLFICVPENPHTPGRRAAVAIKYPF